MAAYTSLLLVIALGAAAVQSLRCYSCLMAYKNTNCLTETNCTDGETYCETTMKSERRGLHSQVTTISKRCTRSCTTSISVSTKGCTSCCTTDLCNYSGGATIRSSCAAILLALGSVLIILKSSVL